MVPYPDLAIDHEKEIKGWRRSKKIRLIESMNPHWRDLAEHWGGNTNRSFLVARARFLARLKYAELRKDVIKVEGRFSLRVG